MDINESAQIIQVDINEILPNRFQPRIEFDESEILGLSDSIKEHGIINPILARKIGNKYEIIAGERRYKAAVLAGLDRVPIIVKDLNDQDSAEIALLENVQRKNMSPIEESISFQKILDMGSITQEQLAEKIGKSQSYIANKIRLLKLSDEVQEALLKNKISERHARSLLKIKEQEKQNKMLEKIIKERLTVRKTDEEIDKMNENNSFFNTVPTIEKTQNEVTPVQEPTPIIPTSLDNIFGSKLIEDKQQEEMAKENEELLKSVQEGNNSFFSFGIQQPIPESQQNEKSNLSVDENLYKNIIGTPEAVSLANEALNNAPILTPSIENENVSLSSIENGVSEIVTSPIIEDKQVLEVPVMPQVEPVQPIEPVIEPQPEMVSTMPQVEPVQPTAPVLEQQPEMMSTVPQVEPVQPIEPVIEPQPEMMSTMPQVEPVQPIETVIEQQPEMVSTMPQVEPIQSTAPVIEPQSTMVPTFEVPTLESTPSIVPTAPIVESSEQIKDEVTTIPEPIIITDYSKQYDPVMPYASTSEPIEKVDFKTIINLIRECSKSIEESGYRIDTEEYDLEGIYQVVFKINKD